MSITVPLCTCRYWECLATAAQLPFGFRPNSSSSLVATHIFGCSFIFSPRDCGHQDKERLNVPSFNTDSSKNALLCLGDWFALTGTISSHSFCLSSAILLQICHCQCLREEVNIISVQDGHRGILLLTACHFEVASVGQECRICPESMTFLLHDVAAK